MKSCKIVVKSFLLTFLNHLSNNSRADLPTRTGGARREKSAASRGGGSGFDGTVKKSTSMRYIHAGLELSNDELEKAKRDVKNSALLLQSERRKYEQLLEQHNRMMKMQKIMKLDQLTAYFVLL